MMEAGAGCQTMTKIAPVWMLRELHEGTAKKQKVLHNERVKLKSHCYTSSKKEVKPPDVGWSH